MTQLLIFGDASYDQTLFAPNIPEPDEKVHCTDLVEGYGGVALNTAIAHACAGGRVRFVAQVGADMQSADVAEYLVARRVAPDLSAVEGNMARVVTVLESHGEKRLLIYPGVSLYPSEEDAIRVALEDVTHVHTAIYGPAGAILLERARAAGLSWSLDLEPATFIGGIDTLAREIDGAALLFVNDRAAAAIGDDAVDRLLAMGAKSVLRTQGPEGATLYGPDGASLARAVPPKNMPILDTTGAGDCLAGWCLARRLAGLSEAEALRSAVTAATWACRAPGAHTGYPQLSDIEFNKGPNFS